MTSWTERYLATALRSIPEPKRADVERELRSSIDDAVEERVGGGEDRVAAERAVLEGLGDPTRLAAGYSGRPSFLIGPELFPIYRRLVPRLLAIIVPISATALAALSIIAGGDVYDGITAAIGAVIETTFSILFFTTFTFVFIERADAAREARAGLVASTGKWTVERLPASPAVRISANETIGEVVTILLMIGGLLLLNGVAVDAPGGRIPMLDGARTGFWVPALIAVLAMLAVLQIVVYAVGRWTFGLAAAFTVLEVAFALPILVRALTGSIINPAFAAQVGAPTLGHGNGPAMLALAIGTLLITAWEIVTTFLRARRAQGAGPLVGASMPSA